MAILSHAEWLFTLKSPNLGTGHYLSPGGGGGGGSEDFGGDHLIFRGTEGGISRSRKPKMGVSLKILKGFRGGPLKSAWTMPDMGVGDHES